MIKFRLLSIFILIFLLVMCAKNNSDVVSMEEFQSKILDENTFVLDVRTEEEFYGPLGEARKTYRVSRDLRDSNYS